MPRIISMLDLSTAHLPKHLGGGALTAIDGVIATPREHGFLLWVPDDPEGHARDYEQDHDRDIVVAIQRYARALGCDYVLLDCDAGQVDELPAWK